MNLFYNSAGSFNDPIISNLIKTLKNAYKEDLILASCSNNALGNHLLAQKIKESNTVFIWNGSEVGCFWVIEICETFNIPYCVFERGLFPQKKSNYMVDRKGICCRSESLKEKYLEKNNKEESLKIVKKHYKDIGVERIDPSSKVVFVLQLEFDSTVYHYSFYKNNEEMVDDFIKKQSINPKDVVICPHPRNKNITSKYKISDQSTIKECQDASLAVGISSTTMYEIMGIGCPVFVLGGNPNLIHPINRSWSDHNLIISSILQNQFEASDDLSSIKEKINKNLKK